MDQIPFGICMVQKIHSFCAWPAEKKQTQTRLPPGPNEALLSPFDDAALFLSTLIRAIVAILRGKLFCLNTVFIKQTISQFRHYFHPIWFYQLLDSLVTLFGRKLQFLSFENGKMRQTLGSNQSLQKQVADQKHWE